MGRNPPPPLNTLCEYLEAAGEFTLANGLRAACRGRSPILTPGLPPCVGERWGHMDGAAGSVSPHSTRTPGEAVSSACKAKGNPHLKSLQTPRCPPPYTESQQDTLSTLWSILHRDFYCISFPCVLFMYPHYFACSMEKQ